MEANMDRFPGSAHRSAELIEDASMTEDTQADFKLSAASEERQKQKDAGDRICSPYLLRPLRTLRQACSDISASHPELIPPGIDVCANAEKDAEYDHILAIKNKGRPPKPWRWEIYLAGKSKPVRQSEFLETMSEATRTGKAALAELRAKRAALTAVIGPSRHLPRFSDTSGVGGQADIAPTSPNRRA